MSLFLLFLSSQRAAAFAGLSCLEARHGIQTKLCAGHQAEMFRANDTLWQIVLSAHSSDSSMCNR